MRQTGTSIFLGDLIHKLLLKCMYALMCQAVYGHSLLIRLMLWRDEVWTISHEDKYKLYNESEGVTELDTHKSLCKRPHTKCKVFMVSKGI